MKDVFPGSKPTGKLRTFSVTVTKTVTLVLDESVIAQGTRADSPIFGPSATEANTLDHLAFNLVGNGLRLSQVDGYANCPDASAVVRHVDWVIEVEKK